MSFDLSREAWKVNLDVQGATSAKFVLLCLADMADDNGQCFPSIKTICERTGLTKKSVQVALGRLVAAGLLRKESRFRPDGSMTSNLYVVTLGGQSLRVVGVSFGGGGGVMVTPQDPITYDPIIEPKNPPTPQKEKNADANVLAMPIPSWLSEDAWKSFIYHRREIKKPLTVRAAELAIKKLSELHSRGHNIESCIEQSILSGWTGIFEPKNNSRPEPRGMAYKTYEPPQPVPEEETVSLEQIRALKNRYANQGD